MPKVASMFTTLPTTPEKKRKVVTGPPVVQPKPKKIFCVVDNKTGEEKYWKISPREEQQLAYLFENDSSLGHVVRVEKITSFIHNNLERGDYQDCKEIDLLAEYDFFDEEEEEEDRDQRHTALVQWLNEEATALERFGWLIENICCKKSLDQALVRDTDAVVKFRLV